MSGTGTGLPPAENGNFTQTALLAGGGLLLLALAAFLGFELCQSGAPSHVGPPEMKIIGITIDKSCAARIAGKQTSVQKDRDVVVWRIESECPAGNALICLTPLSGAPPLRCWGDPEAAEFGKSFPIDDKGKSYIVCALKWPPTGSPAYTYHVELRAQDTAASPPPPPLACLNKDYELALEVVP